jgi:cyanate lyase
MFAASSLTLPATSETIAFANSARTVPNRAWHYHQPSSEPAMTFTPLPVPTRTDAATSVLAAKKRLGLGNSTEWTTSALLGQQTLTQEQAQAAGTLLELDDTIVTALQLPPVRGASVVDTTEPVVYRLQEALQVYGSTIAELVR